MKAFLKSLFAREQRRPRPLLLITSLSVFEDGTLEAGYELWHSAGRQQSEVVVRHIDAVADGLRRVSCSAESLAEWERSVVAAAWKDHHKPVRLVP